MVDYQEAPVVVGSAPYQEEPARRAGPTEVGEQSPLPPGRSDASEWHLGGSTLQSRFLLGTAGYPSPAILQQAIASSGTQVVTVGLRRQLAQGAQASAEGDFFSIIKATGAHLLPNTAGCRTAREAITLAQMARELFDTHWIKLEVVGDEHTLQPDPFELVDAARQLVKDGFEVFPYCTDDLVSCQRLLDVGCKILMPWGAPIGSGQGLVNPGALRTLRARLPGVPLIVDAGIGSPADAVQAMELGLDGVLLNTAVAKALNPVRMARAFGLGIRAGRLAFEAGVMAKQDMAVASTPVAGHPILL
ncbi:thiazole synthase [Rhodoferax sp. AJA081-3]|uniref:thiazole synthase n=1 Tax=Rhodoferax sp. AJA081-3 TaxID=2752316 RepID=UPI001AE097EA|nr:thiazole synthase [Rhodoferax sp. AJA081-3]QTN30200.1 thiazole synthase [Rhodoferax sp. AJA081-3]